MKTPARLLLALGALCLATSLRAQILTFQSQSGYGGSTSTFLSSPSQTQVFTNVSAITSLTYNFFAGSANGNATTVATTLSATFGEWNGSSFVGTPVSLGQVTIDPSNTLSWTTGSLVDSNNQSHVAGTFTYTTKGFDFRLLSGANATYGYLTDASKSYALTLSFVSGDTNLALGANTGSSFTNGYQNPFNPSVFGAGFTGYDYVFSAISIVPGNQSLVPVPEPSTYAAAAGAVFVTGLVFARTRQRRRLAPVAPPAAV